MAGRLLVTVILTSVKILEAKSSTLSHKKVDSRYARP